MSTLLSGPGVLSKSGIALRNAAATRIFAAIVEDAADEATMQTQVDQAILGADILITSLDANPYSTET